MIDFKVCERKDADICTTCKRSRSWHNLGKYLLSPAKVSSSTTLFHLQLAGNVSLILLTHFLQIELSFADCTANQTGEAGLSWFDSSTS
jgi:hypothetical protein